MSDLVETFEQKKDLAKLVEKANNDSEERGLKVYIGEESPVNAMKDCSIVTANCDFGNGMKGTIGIVGPKRMDYEKVLKTIKNTMHTIIETSHAIMKRRNLVLYFEQSFL